MLVDPSLFTAPYDAALSNGLERAGTRPTWATRGLRRDEGDLLGAQWTRDIFYRLTDGPNRRTGRVWRLVKGVEHVIGLLQLEGILRRNTFDLVHFQWAVVPRLDRWAIDRLRRRWPVVLTVHDTTPFNGKAVSVAQTAGWHDLLRTVDGVIVHTETGRRALERLGLAAERITVVPHGLLPSAAQPRLRASDEPWRVVLFGKLQDYKGADVLVEALALLPAKDRVGLHVVIAGEPFIDTARLESRARALGLDERQVEFRHARLSQDEMDDLLASADTFVFPYRAIDASGVLFQIAALGRWVIASDLGAFRDVIGDAGDAGMLVPPGNAAALAEALASCRGKVPTRSLAAAILDWTDIGRLTQQVYVKATDRWERSRSMS